VFKDLTDQIKSMMDSYKDAIQTLNSVSKGNKIPEIPLPSSDNMGKEADKMSKESDKYVKTIEEATKNINRVVRNFNKAKEEIMSVADSG